MRREDLPVVEVADFAAALDADRECRTDVFSFKLLELVRCIRLSLPRFVILCVIRVGFELKLGEKLLCGGASGTGEKS